MGIRSGMRVVSAAGVLIALTASPLHGLEPLPEPPAITIPFAGLSAELEQAQERLDDATVHAFELERQIEDLEADSRALAERISVTAERVRAQRAEVDAAEARLADARDRYEERLVVVYKRGAVDTIGLLLSSETLTDLLARAAVLARIAEDDSRVVSDLNVAASDARYQEATLEELLAQDKSLQREQEDRIDRLARALEEQEALVERLTAEAREALLQARRLDAETRTQWRAASIPPGTDIPRATAVVEPYAGTEYLVSAYMPRRYRSTGESTVSVCSWYGPGFNGRGTASGQVFNEDDFTCASRTLPFGTVLALTRGDRRVIVYVNDRGPFIAGRDLDLSKAAAYALGFSGVEPVRVEVVLPVYE